MLGRTISHYRILSELGRGGMGVVYRALDTRLGREVAIKFLPPHLGANAEARRRFVDEARSASALNHPDICTIHEIDETEDGQTFIVMAHYEGESLRDLMDRGPLPVERVLEIASQVASGLARAHEKGIVHRDIKPSNILVTSDGRAVIIDFGLAKLAGRTKLTREGSTLGTAAYMSPEQARGEEVDHRSDIFSLGTILYEMLAGEPPFRGEHEAALLYEIVHEEPEPLPEDVVAASPGIQEIVGRALAKEPGRRYQYVDDLKADLKRLGAGVSSISTPGKTARPRRKIPSRKRIVYGGGAALAAVIALLGIYLFFMRGWLGDDRRSIAVLPFKSIVTEPGYEWFADGMTEAVIGHLAKIEGLKVISSASTMKFKETGGSLGEIAGKLGVATVLEGSVQQAGGRVHLAVRLIDARSDDYIWSQEYDRGMEDVFAVQADVALNVADRLRATLTSEVEGRIETSPTENIEAYKLLMRGRDIWNRATHEDRLEAIRLFEQASEAAPDYADAYARLADAYRLITLYGYLPPEQMIPKAKEYALKALEIDEGNVLAHATLSGIAGHHEWKWKESERLCLRAIELNPGDAGCHAAYAWDLMLRGRFDEAVAEQRKALELDPLSVGHRQNEGEILYYARRYDESIEASRRAIEMNPNYPQSRMFMGASYLGKGMREEALAALAQEQELSRGTRPEVENWIGFAYAMAGEKEKARAVLDHLLEMSKERWVSPFVIATIYVGLGEQDRGFEWLGKAYEERDSRLAYLKVHPVYDIVKSDPRYLAMLERVGLAE